MEPKTSTPPCRTSLTLAPRGSLADAAPLAGGCHNALSWPPWTGPLSTSIGRVSISTNPTRTLEPAGVPSAADAARAPACSCRSRCFATSTEPSKEGLAKQRLCRRAALEPARRRPRSPAYIRSVRHLPRSFEHRPTGGGRGWVRSPSARTRRVAPTQFPILVCSVGEPGLVDESPRGHRLCGDTPHPPRARAPKVWRTRERLASGAIDGVMSRSCHRRTSAPNAPRCSRAASARPKSEQATLWGESRCAARRAGTA